MTKGFGDALLAAKGSGAPPSTVMAGRFAYELPEMQK